MHKVGVDIIEIDRIQEAAARFGQRFYDRIYTAAERQLCKDKPERLAARFAGKEAVMMALGTGARGVGWRDIEILAKPSGEPTVSLYGRAKKTADGLGIVDMAVSLSHSREYSVATAVAELRK